MSRCLSFISILLLPILFSCQKEKSLELGTPSKGSLQSASGDCLPKKVEGVYRSGKAFSDSNFIEVTVDVAEAGRYTISTDTVNGYYFTGTGKFSGTGAQTVRLKAFGTPGAIGTDDFAVSFDSSLCFLSVDVVSGDAGSGAGDYFPLTQNSFWSYDDGAASDTMKITVSGTESKGGQTYQRFVVTYESGPPNDTLLYRKDNATGFYYNYVPVDEFQALGLTFTTPGIGVLFLKNSLTNGATWNSDFSTTVSGMAATLRFKFSCINNSASITANGKNFSNVYHIRMEIQIGALGTFAPIASPTDFYYAKGIGQIKVSDQGGDFEVIRYWKVL